MEAGQHLLLALTKHQVIDNISSPWLQRIILEYVGHGPAWWNPALGYTCDTLVNNTLTSMQLREQGANAATGSSYRVWNKLYEHPNQSSSIPRDMCTVDFHYPILCHALWINKLVVSKRISSIPAGSYSKRKHITLESPSMIIGCWL